MSRFEELEADLNDCAGAAGCDPTMYVMDTTDLRYLLAENRRLRIVLERLASMEGLAWIGMIPGSMAGDELMARINFARAALEEADHADAR